MNEEVKSATAVMIKNVIEGMLGKKIDGITYISDTEIWFEVNEVNYKVSMESVGDYIKVSSEHKSDYVYFKHLLVSDPDIINNSLNETIKRNSNEEYLENLLKATVKVSKEKEANIIKDKLKKLIDEL